MRRTAAALAVTLALAGCSASTPDPGLGDAAPASPASTTATTTASTTGTAAPTTVAPDPAVVDLMNGAGMTPGGRVIFLASRPALEDKATLMANCAGAIEADPEVFHVLGCFARGRIHVRLPAAAELHDIIYTIAAHELLHAVYAGLGTAERQQLVVELQAARADDPTIDAHLKFYRATAIDTEAHSLAGTEVKAISPSLQAHYAEYIDRDRVLAAYGRTLGDRDDELRRLHASIDESKPRLDGLRDEIDGLRAAGDTRAANALVPGFNALVRAHNAVVAELNAKEEERNQLLRS